MKTETFIEIVSNYYGTIAEKDNCVQFSHFNILNDKKVECIFECYENGTLNGWETTYEINGGFGYPQASEVELYRELERYNFKKKGWEQLRLF